MTLIGIYYAYSQAEWNWIAGHILEYFMHNPQLLMSVPIKCGA